MRRKKNADFRAKNAVFWTEISFFWEIIKRNWYHHDCRPKRQCFCVDPVARRATGHPPEPIFGPKIRIFLRYTHKTPIFGVRQIWLNGIISPPYPEITLYNFDFLVLWSLCGPFFGIRAGFWNKWCFRKCPTLNRCDFIFTIQHTVQLYQGANNLVTLSGQGCLFSKKIA